MSASVRSLAVASIVALLGTEGSPAIGGVFRTRTEQFSQDECPAFNVWPVEEKYTETDDHETLDVTLTLRVQCVVVAGSEVDLAAEPLAVYAHQQIMADESLGNLVRDAKLAATKWTIDGANQDICAFDLDFDVQYQVSRNDPTVNQFFIAA